MASIEARVTTPAVPQTLEVMFPGRARPSRLPLSAFSEEELRKVGEEWTAALVLDADAQRTIGPPEKAPRKRAPKAE